MKQQRSAGQQVAITIGVTLFVLGWLVTQLPNWIATSVTLTPVFSTPTPEPSVAIGAPSSGAHIGTSVVLGNWRYRVVQVDTAQTVDISTDAYFKNVLTAKGLWVMVMIDLTNIGNRNFSINDQDFQLRDDKSIQYDSDFFNERSLARFRQQTTLGDQFPPGVTLRTTLLFDVAPGTNGMYVLLKNVNAGENPIPIWLY